MKILSFSYCFPNHVNPNWGMFVYQRLAALSRTHDLRVCAPVPWFPVITGRHGNPGPEYEHWNEVPVYRPRFFYFPGIFKNHDARFYALGMRRWLERHIRDWRPALLDAHFVWPDGVAVAALGRMFDIPYVITLRGKLYECLKVRSQTRQCAEALSGAAGVISVSGRLETAAREIGGTADRMAIIPNGVDRERFFPRDKRECRHLLGLPAHDRLLVTVAHLGHRKGHHEVLEALAGLPRDVKLVLVGGAAQGGTPETIRTVAQRHGVEDRLILAGPQPYEKVPLYFSAANASVLASYREGCPNAVLESLACGTPVVASDVGAVQDILRAPTAGRIVPLGDVGALREAMGAVLERHWDAEAVLRASGVKSWYEVADDVTAFFHAAIGGRSEG